MKFYCRDIGLSLEIDQVLLLKLIKEGIAKYPNEHGGILIGFYSDDQKTLFIKETILPEDFESSKFSFKRGNKGLKQLLGKLFAQNQSLIYIGEWHTHPDGYPLPSKRDMSAMKDIVEHKNVNIMNPILLIISISKEKNTYSFFVKKENKLYKYDKV